MNFFESKHCLSKIHCFACRTDESWRKTLFTNKVVNSINFNCPYGVTIENVKKQQEQLLQEKNKIYYDLWKELHIRALNHTGTNDSDWLFTNFTPRINFPGCACKRNWTTWVTNHPPRWNDYFSWTVESHNSVNLILNKPIITVEEAKNIWSIAYTNQINN